MKRIVKLSLLVILSTSLMAEDINEEKNSANRGRSVKDVVGNVLKSKPKEVDTTSQIGHMFADGKVSAQAEVLYSGYKIDGSPNIYATAVGGHLMYELAQYKGFNAAVEFSTAHNINFLSGSNSKQNTTMASEDESYTELTQSYINYEYEKLNIRLGRQLIDTPLADSDHVRMIDNTFEAAIFEYKLDEFSFMAGYLSRWQGTDTGLDIDKPWQDTGEDGTYFGGVSFSNELVDISAWYYDISKAQSSNTATGNVANKSSYFDIAIHDYVSQDLYFYLNAQYLHQSEQDSSGVEARIYGFLSELVIDENLAFTIAYNKAEKQSSKKSFSGFGGGTLYTNMDTMIIDEITQDRDAEAIVAGATYGFGDFGFLYAYGDFDGELVEQDIGVEYTANEKLVLAAICVLSDNKVANSGFNDSKNYRIVVAYKF